MRVTDRLANLFAEDCSKRCNSDLTGIVLVSKMTKLWKELPVIGYSHLLKDMKTLIRANQVILVLEGFSGSSVDDPEINDNMYKYYRNEYFMRQSGFPECGKLS